MKSTIGLTGLTLIGKHVVDFILMKSTTRLESGLDSGLTLIGKRVVDFINMKSTTRFPMSPR